MKVAIAGISGRMGQTLAAHVLADASLTLVGGSERPGFDEVALRRSLAAVGAGDVFLCDAAAALAERADCVIDFTSPAATLAMAEAVAATNGIHIIGTTGFSEAEQQQLARFAGKARMVQSGNFSLGVNLLEMLVEQVAAKLADDYDIEIHEAHHRHKKDSPSGTALMLGRAAARGRGVSLSEKHTVHAHGARKRGDIGFSVARGGDIVGIHHVMFAGTGETLTLSHQGFDRGIYAAGALAAAKWAKAQPSGLYSMRDVLASTR